MILQPPERKEKTGAPRVDWARVEHLRGRMTRVGELDGSEALHKGLAMASYGRSKGGTLLAHFGVQRLQWRAPLASRGPSGGVGGRNQA